ncbi:1,4-alpha-glucan branching protein [Streptomyces sp. NPDC044571]|uniref:maltokinase N-terminal cap-like domain-containing protein n=1 Tax=Streptomyces sp. NPDC044571 TaxID=3155371 RepID=UPI0033C4194A
MAVIHRTTLSPTKLELLASWLPGRSWYRATGSEPRLSKAGGFRLDDPKGEVGIEFMAVTDESGPEPVTYLVPLTYRGAPLEGAEEALIGTSEHGVLGRRWIYDGAHDPVLFAQLAAFLRGEAEPQAQSMSDTPDPTVAAHLAGSVQVPVQAPEGLLVVTDGPSTTELLVGGGAGGQLTLGIRRVLRPEPETPADAPPLGHVTAGWTLPDGRTARGRYAVVHA